LFAIDDVVVLVGVEVEVVDKLVLAKVVVVLVEMA